MAVYSLDTGALVKRYVQEHGTAQAMELAERHGLRGYDAVHLASALALQQMREAMELPALTFVSADAQQREAAAAEGFLVEDPSVHR